MRAGVRVCGARRDVMEVVELFLWQKHVRNAVFDGEFCAALWADEFAFLDHDLSDRKMRERAQACAWCVIARSACILRARTRMHVRATAMTRGLKTTEC